MSDLPPAEENEEPTAPFWMATFSDMATLLLTFFVLIVAMSSVEVKKFEEAISYFPGRQGVLQSDAVVPPAQRQTMVKSAAARAQQHEQVLTYLQKEDLGGLVEVNLTEKGLHVTITDSVMFTSGQVELLEPARRLLQVIMEVMGGHIESVVVEGHTDDRPISTAAYPSNWELSASRAASVVRFLLQQKQKLDPSRYLAVGYGEYRPVALNDTPEGRAKNRRVEILFSWEPWQNSPNSYLERKALPAL